MPLPALANNLTVRGWLKYTSYGVEHELCFRLSSTASASDVVVTAGQLATGLKGLIGTTDSFSALRYSVAGSILSFPLSWTAIVGTGGTPSEIDDKAKFIALSGRSSGGYRCRITMFTPAPADTTGYRAGAGTLNSTVAGLTHPLVAVDDLPVIWNSYTNVGYNSYWQRQLR